MAERSAANSGGTVPTPAATVVPLRDGDEGLEVVLLRRNSRGPFGGMWVFPGGKVDEGDAVAGGPAETLEIAVARRAAVREAKEEADLDLDEGDLVTLSFWVPPPEARRRFATWFFLGPTAPHHSVAVDQAEVHEHRWSTPAAAMQARNAGEIQLAPPTFTTLWWLARHSDVESALAAARRQRPGEFATRVATSADGTLSATLWSGDAGYEDADFDRPGPRRRLVMDPAGWRVEISEPG